MRSQIIYDASNFSGPIAIDTLTFFNSVEDDADTFGGPFTITLSTTSAPIGGPSATFADNVGADAQLFAVFAPGVGFPIPMPSFSVTGTPFNYDPAHGNLLLDITSPNSLLSGFIDENGLGTFAVSRVFSLDASAEECGEPKVCVESHRGPVTQFGGSPPPVPEPGTLTLVGIGLCGAAVARRRRR